MVKQNIASAFDKALEYAIYFLFFFIPLSKPGIEICAGLAAFFFILKKILLPDFSFLKNLPNIILVAFFVFCAFSLVSSGPFLDKSLKTLFAKWLKYIFIFLIVQDSARSKIKIQNILIMLSISGLITGIDTIYQYFKGIDFIYFNTMPLQKVTAAFHNQNSLAAYAVPALLITSILFFRPYLNPKTKIYLLCILTALGITIILTFSRSAWASIMAGLFFALIFLRRNKKAVKIISTSIAIFILIILLTPSAKTKVFSIFKEGGDSNHGLLRSVSWSMIKENPILGNGIGTYMDIFPRYYSLKSDTRIQYAHNCYLQIWAETGIFALLSFLGFLWLLLREGIRAFKRTQNYTILALTCGLFGYLVHACFDVHLYSLQLAVLFWSLAGLLSAASSITPEKS